MIKFMKLKKKTCDIFKCIPLVSTESTNSLKTFEAVPRLGWDLLNSIILFKS
jgi:hypothetical protein